MKRIFFFSILALVLSMSSCMTFHEAGRLNMVSVRNIETTKTYQLLQANVEYSSKKEMRQNCKESMEEAVDAVVKKVPGGEYLMNAKIYVCAIPGTMYNGYKTTCYYVVTGDVWGIPPSK